MHRTPLKGFPGNFSKNLFRRKTLDSWVWAASNARNKVHMTTLISYELLWTLSSCDDWDLIVTDGCFGRYMGKLLQQSPIIHNVTLLNRVLLSLTSIAIFKRVRD